MDGVRMNGTGLGWSAGYDSAGLANEMYDEDSVIFRDSSTCKTSNIRSRNPHRTIH